jgi:arsenite/tail-anchored protein-transporting ATPase
MKLLGDVPRYVFFTGKGGVGKTSVACATALSLAEAGRRVLLVSTDPASNLDEVLGTALGSSPTLVAGIARLAALNLDPEAAAHAYRERIVGPYRGILPDASVRSIEEQLSGACTVEIAAFDEFSKLLGDPRSTSDFEHVIFDTAPTGHTLRLLELPAAWTAHIDEAPDGASCLGPLSGLTAQRGLYDSTRRALVDQTKTRFVLVVRPERSGIDEAARASNELTALGVTHQQLVVNGVFSATDRLDPIAMALEERGQQALTSLPDVLVELPRTELRLRPSGLVGLSQLRALLRDQDVTPSLPDLTFSATTPFRSLQDLVPELERDQCGVILTMGKGGVGKTTLATRIARELALRGNRVHFTTTDPAAHLNTLRTLEAFGVVVSHIDPILETQTYAADVLSSAGANLESGARKLLEEELRSPCTQEIAVFRAFARAIHSGQDGFVVIDTAPTGHTVLLLDAAESYHREVLRAPGRAPEDVRQLLPRLRDPRFVKVVIVTLPEATPVHEAEQLQRDLRRAGIEPFAWIVNQSLLPVTVTDPILVRRREAEGPFLAEVHLLSQTVAVAPFDPTRFDSERITSFTEHQAQL